MEVSILAPRSRLESGADHPIKLAEAINRMLLNQLAVSGLLFAALKLF